MYLFHSVHTHAHNKYQLIKEKTGFIYLCSCSVSPRRLCQINFINTYCFGGTIGDALRVGAVPGSPGYWRRIPAHSCAHRRYPSVRQSRPPRGSTNDPKPERPSRGDHEIC